MIQGPKDFSMLAPLSQNFKLSTNSPTEIGKVFFLESTSTTKLGLSHWKEIGTHYPYKASTSK